MSILSPSRRSRWTGPIRVAVRRLSRAGTGRVLFVLLFVAGAGATWLPRMSDVERTVVAVQAPAAPVLAGPIARAEQTSRGRTLEIRGTSDVWEAAPPPPRPRPAPGRSALPIAPAVARTPADEVDRWIVRLATAQRDETRRALERMAAFEPLILQELAERGLPGDLLYLALIESHFVTGATSRAGAVGIWQFMPATARAHGLEVSEWVDERRDPVRSTRAAARHLQWLHRRFGSWHLALAAYNAGDGRVGGVLRNATGGGRGDDVLYWRVRAALPTETQDYVPKLLAASRVAREPEQFGITGIVARPPLRFREVLVPGGVDLHVVAESVGAAPDELYALNPHLVRRATPPGRRWPVRVPAGTTGTLAFDR